MGREARVARLGNEPPGPSETLIFVRRTDQVYSAHWQNHLHSENYEQHADFGTMKPPDGEIHRLVLADFETLVREMASAHAPEFLEVDVTMSQAKVLYMVSIHPGTNMSMVATRLGVGLSAVSGLVDRLVEHGYLTRQEDADDRRQHLLELSPQGTLVIERIRELNVRHFERLIAGLSGDELEALHRGIAAMAREASAQFQASQGDADPQTERKTR